MPVPFPPRTVPAIVAAGLLVGTLDLLAAIIQTLLAGGTVLRLGQYIASGAFGKAAFNGGWPMATYGVSFHYLIAFVFTVLFFAIYPRIGSLARHRFAAGIAYGLFVWTVMNIIVVPHSAITPGAFDLQRATTAAGILIACIGLPLSFLAHRHFVGQKESV